MEITTEITTEITKITEITAKVISVGDFDDFGGWFRWFRWFRYWFRWFRWWFRWFRWSVISVKRDTVWTCALNPKQTNCRSGFGSLKRCAAAFCASLVHLILFWLYKSFVLWQNTWWIECQRQWTCISGPLSSATRRRSPDIESHFWYTVTKLIHFEIDHPLFTTLVY